MAMYLYQKPYAQLTPAKLLSECVAAGLPVTDVQTVGDVAETISVVTSRDLTPAEKTTLDARVVAHDGRPRRPRDLRLILADLDALSSAQKTNVWAYVNGGNPVRWKLSNQGEVWTNLRLSESGALAGAQQTAVRLMAVALYVRNEFPNFLVNNAAVDVSVSVPGDEVAV